MSDLASRLRDAAENMPAAADRLPATLRRAARTRRRHRRLAVASTAVAVTVVVAGTLLASTWSPGGPPRLPAASAPTPSAPTPSGVPGGTVRISAARLTGATLLVSFVGAPEGQPDDPCSRDYRAETEETDRGVTVVVREYRSTATLPPGHGCTLAGYSRRLLVPLAAPLASRPLEDGSTGATVSVFREILTVLPPSEWTLRAESGEPFGWQQTFQGPTGEFMLNQGSRGLGTLSNPSFYQRTGTTTVRGTSARWGTAPGETSIHWVEGDSGIQLMSPDLDLPQLLAIANHLTH